MKKLTCILLSSVTLFLVLFSGCTPLSGSTEFLDLHPVDDIYNAYTDFSSGKRQIDLSHEGEMTPDVNAVIESRLGYLSDRVDVKIANRSHFEITLHGYAWVMNGDDIENASKAIYYNEKKNVANASYTVKYQCGYGGIAPFTYGHVAPVTKDTLIFFFFTYRENTYVGAVRHGNDFLYWPIEQTEAK